MSYTDYEQFVDNLTNVQVRALSSQVGIEAWYTAEVSSLRAILRESERAQEVWANAFSNA